jgi:hypothetical protein
MDGPPPALYSSPTPAAASPIYSASIAQASALPDGTKGSGRVNVSYNLALPCSAIALPQFQLVAEDFVGTKADLAVVNTTATCTNVPGRRLLSMLPGSAAVSETRVSYVYSGGVTAGNYKARGAQVLLAATSGELLGLLQQAAFLAEDAKAVASAATFAHTAAEFFVAEPLLISPVEEEAAALVPPQQGAG